MSSAVPLHCPGWPLLSDGVFWHTQRWDLLQGTESTSCSCHVDVRVSGCLSVCPSACTPRGTAPCQAGAQGSVSPLPQQCPTWGSKPCPAQDLNPSGHARSRPKMGFCCFKSRRSSRAVHLHVSLYLGVMRSSAPAGAERAFCGRRSPSKAQCPPTLRSGLWIFAFPFPHLCI